jgi:hypothetical protein
MQHSVVYGLSQKLVMGGDNYLRRTVSYKTTGKIVRERGSIRQEENFRAATFTASNVMNT